MEQNPLSSKDAMHGIPPLWNDILNDIAREEDDYQSQESDDIPI